MNKKLLLINYYLIVCVYKYNYLLILSFIASLMLVSYSFLVVGVFLSFKVPVISLT